MAKPGIRVEIPGYGTVEIRHLVTDYSGTLSCGGKLSPGVQERLLRLDELLDLHVLTSDTFGTAAFELQNIPVHFRILSGGGHDRQKQDFVRSLGAGGVAALGNGRNDRFMLATVREAGGVAVAVDAGEGCALETILSAHVLVQGAVAALDLLLDPFRLKADLRS